MLARASTQVRLVRADARRLPYAAAQFDGSTAVSALEHVTGAHGDRQTLAECARVLRPGGVGLVTVPFRAEGSVQERTEDLDLFQWQDAAAARLAGLGATTMGHPRERTAAATGHRSERR